MPNNPSTADNPNMVVNPNMADTPSNSSTASQDNRAATTLRLLSNHTSSQGSTTPNLILSRCMSSNSRSRSRVWVPVVTV